MSFPRYPKYKDSGVEWLGEVPGYWEVLRIKHLVASLEQGWSPQCEGFPVQSEDEWGVLKVGCVNGGVFRPEENKTLPPELEPLPELGLASGDLLISRANTRELVGSAAVALRDYPRLMLCDKLFRLRLQAEACVPVFLALYLGIPRVRGQIELSATGASSSMLNIGQSTILELDVAVPPSDEQTAIAAFLGRETTKIDALVAEQENLIGLLKEKRSAVISHAVTKGLDPSVPMKDSGVEWLGEVPAHWSVGKCGFYVSVLSGFAFPSSGFITDENATKLLRGVNVGIGRLKWDESVYWNRVEGDGLDAYQMNVGDLVIGMDRPLIADGMRVARVKESDLPCLLLQRVASLQTNEKLTSDYLFHLLASDMFVAHFEPETTGVSVPHISPEQIKNFLVPIPPVEEQRAICDEITTAHQQFDALIFEAESTITLLQERRSALISAAVTGQIDVRGLSHVDVA